MTEEAEIIEPTEVGDSQEAPEDTSAYEAEAKKYGWTPIEDWRGAPESHIDAKRYMERGPGQGRKLTEENKALAERLERMESAFAERLERNERAQKAAYEAQLREKINQLEQQKRQAVETGDVKAYEAAQRSQQQIQQQAKQQPQLSEPETQAINTWIAAHPEYRTDKGYQGRINALYAEANSYGITDVTKVLAYIDKHNTPAPAPVPPAVEGGGVNMGSGKKRGWESIPNADRAVAEKQITQGMFDDLAKELGVSPRQAFAQMYFEEVNNG